MAAQPDETANNAGWLEDTGKAAPAEVFGLVLAWSLAEPARVGEVARMPGPTAVLGRGGGAEEDAAPRLVFLRSRPGEHGALVPLAGQGLSRIQLRLQTRGASLEVINAGRAALRVNGVTVPRALVSPGDVLHIERQLVLLVVRQPSGLLSGSGPAPSFAFGEPDPIGLVGESPVTWMLRDQIELAARRPGHALILGQSGVGKELVARALHDQSSRSQGPFVARNAATLPPGVLDAELFGNARNYPNPGLRERPGLVGEAHGGTLFLDEIGELPQELQAHLLRLMDHGEYHRLGESTARRSDLRVVAATNREEAALKADLCARFPIRLQIPGLDARRDEIPLLVRHWLRTAERREPGLVARFQDPESGSARIDPALIDALLRHRWSTHIRELDMLLSLAVSGSPGVFISLTEQVKARLDLHGVEPSAAEVEAALERTRGNVSQAFKELGLPSRDVLYRLMKTHGITPERPSRR
ncbi:MAG: sigma 54-interacting transcriptional regulator [Polyangiaceae bacterium]|jgi:two-component system nitrogen regulation response regulator GlnG/two-component system response regulator HydG|nr:sigma 54-interacting transcriptional regulator [Polyangiaceae bacterium]